MSELAHLMLEYDTGTKSAASPIELARRAADGDFDYEVLAWLQDGFRHHVDGGADLEKALRLDRVSRMRERDDALRVAAGLLTLGSADAWPVAGRLAQAVARHKRMRGEPVTLLEKTMAKAFDCGVGVPSGQRQLYRIINPLD